MPTMQSRNSRLSATLCLASLAIAVACKDDPPTATGNPTTWQILGWAAGSSTPQPTKPVTIVLPPVVESDDDTNPETIQAQREVLFRRMKNYFGHSDETMAAVQKIFEASAILSQGNPVETKHPMTRGECFKIREEAELTYVDNPVCGMRNMVPLYNAKDGEEPESAKACIDQYEFPNMPCEYPVVHVSPREAALLCKAVNKRLCDAHEWEGGCAGNLRVPKEEYAFGRVRKDMKSIHNANREVLWAYGKEKNHGLCGTRSFKNSACQGGGYRKCGSNTYPSGAFPKCVSPFGVYDLHGNAAEHMNYPLKPDELTSLGRYGDTEMKGSWFIFASYEAHEDDCHWRAPDWHATNLMSPGGHTNYHLGFRCCSSVGELSEGKGER
ncbi:MAG: formylglycine-generating enzyme family protein [Polyangiaceae bacterium]|nr:formylglycine-generating enzyme family protein [Polyangiaceae bacterium]